MRFNEKKWNSFLGYLKRAKGKRKTIVTTATNTHTNMPILLESYNIVFIYDYFFLSSVVSINEDCVKFVLDYFSVDENFGPMY